MSEKTETGNVRISQVMAGALAATTAAVLGSTMGFAGTVIGAGLASVLTTVGGALYLRSIQRTKQGVRTVRNLVVARAGATSVTLVEEKSVSAEPETAKSETGEPVTEPATEPDEANDEEQSDRRRIRWPAVIAASVLAFVLGMLVIAGVELIRGEPLSGGEGTTLGRIVRSDNGGADERDNAPPPATTSTTPTTGDSTVTVTSPPPTSENAEPESPTESEEPGTTAPDTTTGGEPTGSAPVPEPGQ